MTEPTTTTWHPSGNEDSSTVDLGGTGRRRLPDPHKPAREALTAVMGRLEELYRHAVPLVNLASSRDAWAVTEQIQSICDALGRIKIGLLPRS
ncbi:MAG TPA: hypothetical protein VKE98_20750 [Gemmataceae bacterium]|nr:hypothetical protein [Gemmataceae bacterium]